MSMTKSSRIFIWGLFFLLQAQICQANTWEYWGKYDFRGTVSERIKLAIKPQIRIKDDMSDFYYFRTDVGPLINVAEYLEVAVYYVYKKKEAHDIWKVENIGCLDGTLKWKSRGFKFSCRNRAEYSLDKREWVYRNELKIKKSLQVNNQQLTPFFAEEVFYDFSAETTDESRTSVGISTKVTGAIKLELSYLLDHKKQRGNWGNTSVIVSNVKFSF